MQGRLKKARNKLGTAKRKEKQIHTSVCTWTFQRRLVLWNEPGTKKQGSRNNFVKWVTQPWVSQNRGSGSVSNSSHTASPNNDFSYFTLGSLHLRSGTAVRSTVLFLSIFLYATPQYGRERNQHLFFVKSKIYQEKWKPECGNPCFLFCEFFRFV